MEGPAALKLAWTGALHPGTSAVSGTVDLRGLRLSSVELSPPLTDGAGTIALKGGERDVRISAAAGAWRALERFAAPARRERLVGF